MMSNSGYQITDSRALSSTGVLHGPAIQATKIPTGSESKQSALNLKRKAGKALASHDVVLGWDNDFFWHCLFFCQLLKLDLQPFMGAAGDLQVDNSTTIRWLQVYLIGSRKCVCFLQGLSADSQKPYACLFGMCTGVYWVLLHLCKLLLRYYALSWSRRHNLNIVQETCLVIARSYNATFAFCSLSCLALCL